MTSPVAVIGGGLAGLTCAIRLAEQGKEVVIFEAAPQPGGRTRSHFDAKVNQWVDNGPHLMIGAYEATQKLLADCGASDNVTWQPSLHLPLFDELRGHFSLTPKPWLPFPIALLLSIARMPGHGLLSIKGMLRIALAMKKPARGSVRNWLDAIAVPDVLVRDMLEPLCLGTMNEAMASADADSFARVLIRAFESHRTARLGWFNRPLSEGLIAPLQHRFEAFGGTLRTSTTVRDIETAGDHCTLRLDGGGAEAFSHVVIALPAQARNRLLGIEESIETSPITNVHLWFDEKVTLPEPLIGSIGSFSQWFFDISGQFDARDSLSHLCAVISADAADDRQRILDTVLKELGKVVGRQLPAPAHHKIVCEKHATVLVRDSHRDHSGGRLIDASEAPEPGQLPATIEVAVMRGEAAAKQLLAGV